MAQRAKLNSVADLPAFIGAESTSTFDTFDEKALGPAGKQLYEENMVIVDGWRTSPSFLLLSFHICWVVIYFLA